MPVGEKHTSLTSKRISRRNLLIVVGAALAGAGIDQGISRLAWLSERNALRLREIKPGESLPFLREVKDEGFQSGFTEPEFRIVHSTQMLEDDILMRIRDPKTHLPIEFTFDPKIEVAAIVALGEKDLPHSVQIKGAIETDGIMRIIAEEKYPFLPHGRTIDRRIPEKRYSSPFHLVIFPRVEMRGEELQFEFARPERKLDPYFDAETM